MREAPGPRLPRPIDPVGRSPLGRWRARRRYERRWGFLPSEGREELPETGRTVLYRVQWGRAAFDVCVMLARWEHVRGAWRRRDVVAHEWVSDGDGAALGAARHRLGTLGERLEEEADDARLAGRSPAELSVPGDALPVLIASGRRLEANPHDRATERLPRPGALPRSGQWVRALALLAFAVPGAVLCVLGTVQADTALANAGLWAIIGGAPAATTVLHVVLLRRADPRTRGQFVPRLEQDRRPSPDGRTILYRVDVGWREEMACVMVARWRYRRGLWKRRGVVEHAWVEGYRVPEAVARAEARARALERAEPDDVGATRLSPAQRRAAEAGLDDLVRELEATEGLVEDLAEDPR